MFALLACVEPTPISLLEADSARTGALGADGPYGAVLTTHTWSARVVGRVDAELVLPVDDAGNSGQDLPVVVFVQGGAVPVERYRWIAAHFASRGYAVISPLHDLDLAIFSSGNAQDALLGARLELDGVLGSAAAVGGHSLGGVVAVKNWLAEDQFQAAFLLASYADTADDPTLRAGSPVLSIVGANDQSAPPDTVEAEFERFAAPRWFAEVDGLNHYGWTDGATEDELAGDGPLPDLATSRLHGLDVVDTFLDAALRADADAQARLDAGTFDGVAVHE